MLVMVFLFFCKIITFLFNFFQAAGFKERILTPREDAKQKKKEELFCRFLGPAWKGKGVVLGVRRKMSFLLIRLEFI